MLNKYVVLPAIPFLSHSWSKTKSRKRKRYVVPLGCGRLREERRFLCDKGLPKLRIDVYRCSLPCCRLHLCQLVLYVVICCVLAIPPARSKSTPVIGMSRTPAADTAIGRTSKDAEIASLPTASTPRKYTTLSLNGPRTPQMPRRSL